MNAMHTTWEDLDTRKGQLLEMAATLRNAHSAMNAVLKDYPEEAVGSAWLEMADYNARSLYEIANAADAAEDRLGQHHDCGNCGGELMGARDDYQCKDCGMTWYVTGSGSREPRGKS